MNIAILEAQKALLLNEVPIGAIVVSKEGEIIGRGHNLRESQQNAVAHAEILAIQQACEHLSQWRLSECTLYVTLEPCFMCAGAIVLARLSTVVYGACDPKAGAVKSLANVLNDSRLNHTCQIYKGVCKDKSGDLLKEFFRAKRKNKFHKKTPSEIFNTKKNKFS